MGQAPEWNLPQTYSLRALLPPLELHAERKMDLRRSALGGIPKVTETGGHEYRRIVLGHGGDRVAPVEPLERVVVVHPDCPLEALLDREVLVDRGVGPDDPLHVEEVVGHVAAGVVRSYYHALVAPCRSVRLEDRSRTAVGDQRVLPKRCEAVGSGVLPPVPKLRNLGEQELAARVRLVARIGLPGAGHAGQRVGVGAARVAETHGCGRPDGEVPRVAPAAKHRVQQAALVQPLLALTERQFVGHGTDEAVLLSRAGDRAHQLVALVEIARGVLDTLLPGREREEAQAVRVPFFHLDGTRMEDHAGAVALIVDAAQVGIDLLGLGAVNARRIDAPGAAVERILGQRQIDDLTVGGNTCRPRPRAPVVVAAEADVMQTDVRQFHQVILLDGALHADIPVQRVGVVVVGGNYGDGGARRWRRGRGGDLSGGILRDRGERRHARVDVEERRVTVGRLGDGLVKEAAAADLGLLGIQVPIQRHHPEARADHRIFVDTPGQAEAGPEIVVVTVPEEALGLGPGAHASARRAGQEAGNGTAGVIVVRHGQTSDTEQPRELAVRRGLIAVTDADVQGEVRTYPPVVLDIEAVVGVYRKVALSLLGVAVVADVA